MYAWLLLGDTSFGVFPAMIGIAYFHKGVYNWLVF